MKRVENSESGLAIIIAAYNSQATLGATLDSIVRQSQRPSRVVVIDDGSHDLTATCASAYRAELPIDVLKLSKNGGPGLARNVGIRAVSEKFISIVDADDLLLVDHVAQHVQAFDRGANIVATRWLAWTASTGVLRDTQPRVPAADRQWPAILSRNFLPGCSSFRRDSFEAVGGYRADVMEDWDLWIRMLRQGMRATIMREPTYLYRQAPDSRGSSYHSNAIKRQVLLSAYAVAGTSCERRRILVGWRQLRAEQALGEADDALMYGNRRLAVAKTFQALQAPRSRTKAAALKRFGSQCLRMASRMAAGADRSRGTLRGTTGL